MPASPSINPDDAIVVLRHAIDFRTVSPAPLIVATVRPDGTLTIVRGDAPVIHLDAETSHIPLLALTAAIEAHALATRKESLIP